MKNYTIAPSQQVASWFIKLENEVVEEEYPTYDGAIEAGEYIARNNRPSMLTILDENHEVKEESTFKK